MDSSFVKEAFRLRSRARWYRMFAKLGDPSLRPDREALAEQYERMAEKAERQENNK
jgi:hypothetical protein